MIPKDTWNAFIKFLVEHPNSVITMKEGCMRYDELAENLERYAQDRFGDGYDIGFEHGMENEREYNKHNV